MHKIRTFHTIDKFNWDEVTLSMGTDWAGKPKINVSNVAVVTPPCITLWPRCTGTGNFGTTWGPSEVTKSKYTLDLTDNPIGTEFNNAFDEMADRLEVVDDSLLKFVFANQQRILGRKNLSIEELKMLQIRSVRPKHDKQTGDPTGRSFQLNSPVYRSDGVNGKFIQRINICDKDGTVITNGNVCPGDAVAATMYAAQVYTGVGGDKFGIQWSFEDVQVVCQRAKLMEVSHCVAFGSSQHACAQQYASADKMEEEHTNFSTNGYDGGQFGS
jgi:hypothetical protein